MATPKFAVDQLVWVRTWGDEEESGNIVSIVDSSNESEEDTNDGADVAYVVRLLVTQRNMTFSESQIRVFDEGATGRRSRHNLSRPAVTPSPPVSVERFPSQHIEKRTPAAPKKSTPAAPKPVPKPKSKRKATPKLDVEPSPLLQATDSPHFAKKRSRKKELASAAKQFDFMPSADDAVCQPIVEETDDSPAVLVQASSDDDTDDRPFKVSYAPTGRARCARCDMFISKGELRITHMPLFRGKQGFQVSRHLACAIFSEDVHTAEDVGGYQNLKTPEDYQALCRRVEESKKEVEDENKELQPDELVTTLFQGEIRSSPPGLVASLLPFQVEGVSWMHHQETKVPEIRGGILADEMGMVGKIDALLQSSVPHTSPSF